MHRHMYGRHLCAISNIYKDDVELCLITDNYCKDNCKLTKEDNYSRHSGASILPKDEPKVKTNKDYS